VETESVPEIASIRVARSEKSPNMYSTPRRAARNPLRLSIEHADRMPARKKSIDNVRTYETATPEHQSPHFELH